MKGTAAWAVWILAPCLMAGAALPGQPAKEFRISGTVTSSRDGLPVPYCLISASSDYGSVNASPARGVGRRPGAAPDRPAFRQGGPAQQNRGSRPTPARDAAASQDMDTRADSSGRFTLELPHGGSWRVSAAARGFRTQLYDEHEEYYSSVVLSDAVSAYDLKFQLTPDAVINGMVIDEAGEPVANAQVIAELVPALLPGQNRTGARPRQVGNAQTDDRGRYELAGLAAGNYHLRVQAQPWYATGTRGGQFRGGGVIQLGGMNSMNPSGPAASPDPSLDVVYQTTWFPASDKADGAKTIALAGGEERQADFHLTPIAAAHLVISRPDVDPPPVVEGRPRQQRPVTITRVTSDGSFGQTSFLSGNEREWDLGGLAPGTYEVQLPGPGAEQDAQTRQVEVRAGSSGVITMENSIPLTRVTIKTDGVGEGEIQFVEFTDTETGRRIISNPPPRLRRGRWGEDGGDPGDEPPPGMMNVMLPPHGYEVNLAGGNAYLTGISAAGASVAGRTVEIGSEPAVLTLRVASERGEVAGVAQMQGQPDSGAMVLLVPATLGQPGQFAPLMRDQTNTDGGFTFRGVIPGAYILVAIDHGWKVDWHDPATLAKYLAQGVPVEVKGSGKVHEEIAAVLP